MIDLVFDTFNDCLVKDAERTHMGKVKPTELSIVDQDTQLSVIMDTLWSSDAYNRSHNHI